MKHLIPILSILALAALAGCSTLTKSTVTGSNVTPAINIDAPTYVVLGDASTATAEVSVAAGTVAELGTLSWGLNGTTTTSDLRAGTSTSLKVTLGIPASLTAGTYTLTAQTPAVTGTSYTFAATSTSATVKVIDLPTIVNNVVTAYSPTITSVVSFGVQEYLKSNDNETSINALTLASTMLATATTATSPTAANFAAVLVNAGVESTVASEIGTLLETAYSAAAAQYTIATGKTMKVSELYSDSKYATAITKLLSAVQTGIANGVAAHTGTTTTN